MCTPDDEDEHGSQRVLPNLSLPFVMYVVVSRRADHTVVGYDDAISKPIRYTKYVALSINAQFYTRARTHTNLDLTELACNWN